MKLPNRRQFLHLAAGAAALPAVSRIARAQKLSDAAGTLRRRFCRRAQARVLFAREHPFEDFILAGRHTITRTRARAPGVGGVFHRMAVQ